MRTVAKPLFRRTLLRDVCADMRRAEAVVRESGLDWTIVVPPRLPGQAGHRAVPPGLRAQCRAAVTIPRADVATAILEASSTGPTRSAATVFVAT